MRPQQQAKVSADQPVQPYLVNGYEPDAGGQFLQPRPQ
jgi:hypothetical protein